MIPAVTTDHLSKTYSRAFSKRSVHALRELSLQIEPGEIFGLLGPNGAGKTTLLKLLLGIVRPSSGSAFLFGTPATDHLARLSVGYLPENHRFPPFLTGAQALVVYGRLSKVETSIVKQRSGPLLEQVGLSDWANVRMREYSKGMMQRLGLAQTLLNNPTLLFLDEPTDGVDPIGRRQIRDLLLSLRNEGMTVFLNSHLLSEVEMVCTRVGILHRGRMVQTGSIAELTGGLHRYRFRFPLHGRDTLEQTFPELAIQSEADDAEAVSVGITGETPERLNGWIDRFRSAGLEILRIGPDHRSLEARFMEIIESLESPQSKEPTP